MKRIELKSPHVLLLLLVLLLVSSCRENVSQFAATEVFPEDSILTNVQPKRAMIVVAHDDDMCATAGTISKLNKQGWAIQVLSLPKSASRNRAQRKSCKHILDSVLFLDIRQEEFRLHNVEKNYEAIPKAAFDSIFNKPLVAKHLTEQINRFQPAVIFTLDNEIGGYGHPEHVFMSQLVLDLAKSDSISPQFIYQSVYTDHMENTIMQRHAKRMKSWGFDGNEWEIAKKTYQVSGMPEPDVQINITSEAEEKMKYLRSYNERERKTLGFFIPAFEEYSAEEYFSIFDHEFYRIIAF